MAKLAVNLSVTFVTGPLYVHNRQTSTTDELKGKELLEMFEKADPQKLGFELISINDEDVSTSFNFDKTSGKKSALIEFTPLPDGGGLNVRIDGQFEVKLRAGVAPYLQEKYGDRLDLRLHAATYNGGEWSGFSAYLDGIGQMPKDRTTLPKIGTFSIK